MSLDLILVERERTDQDGRPIRPDDDWFDKARKTTAEIKREAEHCLAESPGSLTTFDFESNREIYADSKVQIALKKLFYEKCAYCESKPTATASWDVEHYRPKGRIAGRKDHPGYYWLAYEWSNLYLSCQRCNRRLRDKGTWDDRKIGPPAGKLDQFPVEDEAKRAMSHLDLHEEEAPILLDPCQDNPEEFLTFALDGSVQAIDDNERGRQTIEILHLHRKDLIIDRQSRIWEVLAVIKTVRDSADDPAEALNKLSRIYFRPGSRYSAVCRAIWRNPTAFGLPVEVFQNRSSDGDE